jgi:hypothetical protein
MFGVRKAAGKEIRSGTASNYKIAAIPATSPRVRVAKS